MNDDKKVVLCEGCMIIINCILQFTCITNIKHFAFLLVCQLTFNPFKFQCITVGMIRLQHLLHRTQQCYGIYAAATFFVYKTFPAGGSMHHSIHSHECRIMQQCFRNIPCRAMVIVSDYFRVSGCVLAYTFPWMGTDRILEKGHNDRWSSQV